MRGAPETLRPAADSRSGSEDLVEQRFGLVLVGLLGQGELADQDLPGLGEHAFLPRRKTALPVPAPQIPDYLGHLVHVARGELLQVGLVPAATSRARPARWRGRAPTQLLERRPPRRAPR